MKTLAIITQPSVEPLTLQEAKDFLKISDTSQDVYLTSLITAVRQAIEHYCCSSFISQVLRLTIDYSDLCNELALWQGPVSLISSFKIFDSENIESTISNTMYFLHDDYLYLNQNFSIDITLREKASIQITYTAGYGATALSVPKAIKQAILEQIGSIFYCNQEGSMKILLTDKAKVLIDSCRLIRWV